MYHKHSEWREEQSEDESADTVAVAHLSLALWVFLKIVHARLFLGHIVERFSHNFIARIRFLHYLPFPVLGWDKIYHLIVGGGVVHR